MNTTRPLLALGDLVNGPNLAQLPKVALEVGCGDGGFLHHQANQESETFWLGIEKEYEWARKAEKNNKDTINSRVFCANVRRVFPYLIERFAFDAVWMNFPDPWPKKKHANRRLSLQEFVNDIGSVLKEGGHFHLATDVPEYASELHTHFSSSSENLDNWNILEESPRTNIQYQTKYERRWREMGKPISFLSVQLEKRQTREITPTYDRQAVENLLTQNEALDWPHDTELRRGNLVARWTKPAKGGPMRKIHIARLDMPVHWIAQLEKAGEHWVWRNLDEWLLTAPHAALILQLAIGPNAVEQLST